MLANLIVGGGITGLAAAWEISQRGQTALLLEKAGGANGKAELGGVMRTDTMAGCVVERGPDSFLAAKPAAVALLRELGMESELIGSNDASRVTYIVRKGKMVQMPDGLMMMVPTKILPLVTSSLLSWGTKCKMGLEFFTKANEQQSERSVAELVRQHYGQEAVDYLAEPLLSGVYGGDPEKLSASAVLGQFVEMESKYGSLTKGTLAMRRARKSQGQSGPLFRTLKNGLGSWIAQLEEKVQPAVRLQQGEVVELHKIPGGYCAQLLSGEAVEAKNVLVAAPAYCASTMLQRLDPTLASMLGQITYNSSMTIALGYNQADLAGPLPGFGFLVPKLERGVMVACTFVKNKFDHRVPADKAVARCFLGGASFHLDDEHLIGLVREELAKLVGITAEPIFAKVNRWPQAMAQYAIGHQTMVKEIKGRVKMHAGLALAGNAYEGIGIPDCIRGARAAVVELLQTGA